MNYFIAFTFDMSCALNAVCYVRPHHGKDEIYGTITNILGIDS